eukprot:1001549-Amphidinium_carterae.1
MAPKVSLQVKEIQSSHKILSIIICEDKDRLDWPATLQLMCGLPQSCGQLLRPLGAEEEA